MSSADAAAIAEKRKRIITHSELEKHNTEGNGYVLFRTDSSPLSPPLTSPRKERPRAPKGRNSRIRICRLHNGTCEFCFFFVPVKGSFARYS